MAASDPGSAPSSRRWHDLDALRAFAMLLGIGLHAALSFYPSAWPVQDVTASYDGWFDEAVLAVHGFRMPLFFMLSGFFTALLWRRRGLSSLLGQRMRRVVLPFVLGLLLIAPTVGWVAERAVESQVAESGDLAGAAYLGYDGARGRHGRRRRGLLRSRVHQRGARGSRVTGPAPRRRGLG